VCKQAAAQCGLFTHKSVPVIFEPPCIFILYGNLFMMTKVIKMIMATVTCVLFFIIVNTIIGIAWGKTSLLFQLNFTLSSYFFFLCVTIWLEYKVIFGRNKTLQFLELLYDVQCSCSLHS